MDDHIKEWLINFNHFLEQDNKDIIGLYNERILFTPDADNQIKPHILPLNESYASKEQLHRMNEVFEEYLKTHSI